MPGLQAGRARPRSGAAVGTAMRDDVHLAEELAVVAERLRVVLRGEPRAPAGVGVHDAHQVHVPQLGVGQDVVLPHVPGAHDAGPHAASARASAHLLVPYRRSARGPGQIPRLEPR